MAEKVEPWPEEFPVKVNTTMGHTDLEVSRTEYADLRNQGLIDFGATKKEGN